LILGSCLCLRGGVRLGRSRRLGIRVQRVVLTLNGTFKVGTALDGDGLVNDVAFDARSGCQAHFQAAHTAHDAAVDHNVVCDHFAFDCRTFTDGQQMRANVASLI